MLFAIEEECFKRLTKRTALANVMRVLDVFTYDRMGLLMRNRPRPYRYKYTSERDLCTSNPSWPGLAWKQEYSSYCDSRKRR